MVEERVKLRVAGWLFFGALAGASGCRPDSVCSSHLEPTGEPPSPADLARPVTAHIVDTGLISESSRGCSEYGDQVRSGTLGPFAVEYDVFDYKGLPVTTGTQARIFDPTCRSRAVSIRMDGAVDAVELRSDPASGLYFISPHRGPDGAFAVRVVHAGR